LREWWKITKRWERKLKTMLGRKLIRSKREIRKSLLKLLNKVWTRRLAWLWLPMSIKKQRARRNNYKEIFMKNRQNSMNKSNLLITSSNRFNHRRVSSRKERLPLRIRIRESMILKRKPRNWKNSNSCLITRSRNSKEILDLENLKFRSSTNKPIRWDRSSSILTESIKTWLLL